MASSKPPVDFFAGTTDPSTDTDPEASGGDDAGAGLHPKSRYLEHIRKGMGEEFHLPGYKRRLAHIIKTIEAAAEQHDPSGEEEYDLFEIGEKEIKTDVDWGHFKVLGAEKMSLLSIRDIFKEDFLIPENSSSSSKRFKSSGDNMDAAFAKFEAYLKDKIIMESFTKEQAFNISEKDVKRYLNDFKKSFSPEIDDQKKFHW
jgi:hypothetical protein